MFITESLLRGSQQIAGTVNITQIVLIISSLWTANNAVLVYYVWYTSFFMCVYISKFLRTANNAYFSGGFFVVVLTLCLKSLQWLLFFNQFVCFTSCDSAFPTLRSTMELQILHGFVKRSDLKVFNTISKSQHRRFQSKSRCYWKF